MFDMDCIKAVAYGAAAIGTIGIQKILSDREKIRKECQEINAVYTKKELNTYQLEIGYIQGSEMPIVVDMKKTPHMLVAGMSQQGKTSMVEHAIKGKDVILINTFQDQFLSVEGDRINGIEDIERILRFITDNITRSEEPLYLVIDEMLQLAIQGGKKIQNLITQILATGAHKNIYLIAIAQYAEKEVIQNKNLFSARVCFKMVEESSYRTVLGYAPEEPIMRPREFYYFTTSTGKGNTYDL